jgi:hypothetical protein
MDDGIYSNNHGHNGTSWKWERAKEHTNRDTDRFSNISEISSIYSHIFSDLSDNIISVCC